MASALAQSDLVTLLARVGAGDRSAFDKLYSLTSAKLLGVATRILGSGELAEEAVQEAYVRVWKNAARFDASVASPVAWLAAITRNQAIDVRRRSSQRLSDHAAPIDDELVCPSPSPAAETERNDELRRLMGCLQGLPEDRRQMVLLAYYNGWSREELSDRFQRPVATVKSLLRRSLELLKGCLDG